MRCVSVKTGRRGEENEEDFFSDACVMFLFGRAKTCKLTHALMPRQFKLPIRKASLPRSDVPDSSFDQTHQWTTKSPLGHFGNLDEIVTGFKPEFPEPLWKTDKALPNPLRPLCY
eukprot:scaffold3741_cov127-Cylindrotheca_fusiformis.AAC.3